MRRPTLERRSSKADGRVITAYLWRGETIQVNDSARTAIIVRAALEDEGMTTEGKAMAIFGALFPCEAILWGRTSEEVGDLLSDTLWDAFGMDVTEGHVHTSDYEDPVFDFEQDAARIKASLLLAYGIDWESAAETLPYADFMGLLLSLLETEQTTPFERAIYFRTASPQKKNPKYSDYLEAFRSAQDHYALDREDGGNVEGQAHDMFSALKRIAQGGA